MTIGIVLYSILAYLIGSVPTAYLVGKAIKGIDIRKHGSGNVGATNVFRTVGKGWGVCVLICDMLKGIIAVIVLSRLYDGDFDNIKYAQMIYGVFAICGHNWTLFLGFKGGKGVATTAGVIAAMFPLAFSFSFIIFITTVVMTRIVSISSLISAFAFPIFFAFLYNDIKDFYVFLGISILLVIFIFIRHRKNITRLIKGEEKNLI